MLHVSVCALTAPENYNHSYHDKHIWRTAAQRDAIFEKLLLTVWIKPATWLCMRLPHVRLASAQLMRSDIYGGGDQCQNVELSSGRWIGVLLFIMGDNFNIQINCNTFGMWICIYKCRNTFGITNSISKWRNTFSMTNSSITTPQDAHKKLVLRFILALTL